MRTSVSSALALAVIALIISGVVFVITYYQIQELKDIISSQQSKLEEISFNVNSASDKLSGLEQDVNAVSDSISDLQTAIQNVGERLALVEGKVSDFEGMINELRFMVEESRYPMTFVDATGRSVTIPKKPVRIVSTAPSITEILFLIGAGKFVVGVDQFSNYPSIVQELKDNGTLTVVGGYSTVNVELILSLKPDLVLMDAGLQERFAKQLSDMGLTVLVLKSSTISDVFSNVLLLGTITGQIDNALMLVSEMRDIISDTRVKVIQYLNSTGARGLKVYYEIFPDYWTIGGTSYINDIISLAGGINIFANETQAYFVVSPEAVISADPDIIIMNYNYGYYGSAEDLVNRVTSREGWSNITAIVSGRIYVLSGELEDIMVRPGPRSAIAVAAMARIMYPEAFGIQEVPTEINGTILQSWGISTDIGT